MEHRKVELFPDQMPVCWDLSVRFHDTKQLRAVISMNGIITFSQK